MKNKLNVNTKLRHFASKIPSSLAGTKIFHSITKYVKYITLTRIYSAKQDFVLGGRFERTLNPYINMRQKYGIYNNQCTVHAKLVK